MNDKLTPGMMAALRWLAEKPEFLMPHTTNPPYCNEWRNHIPATPASFYALRKRGLAQIEHYFFWQLTDEGKKALQ